MAQGFGMRAKVRGPALVLIAGEPGSSHDYFHPYFSPLAAHYRVIYFDAFGRGKSDKAAQPSEYTFARDVDDLEGLRAALKLGRISVFGHSYGGFVAQAYALKYPNSTRSIILANTFISFQATEEAAAVRERFVQDFFPELWDRIEPLKKQPPSAVRDENDARDEKIDALRRVAPAEKQEVGAVDAARRRGIGGGRNARADDMGFVKDTRSVDP